MRRPLLESMVLAIAGLTVVTGGVQMIAPGRVLRVLRAEQTATTGHFFGIVGMFMVVVGGLAFHALFGEGRDPLVFLWASLQKFGAAAAVGLGVVRGLFSPLALLVAGFDFASGILFVWYWRTIRADAAVPGYAHR